MGTACIAIQQGNRTVVGAVWGFERERRNPLSLERVRVAHFEWY